MYKEIRKLLVTWRMRHVSDANATKLLLLYIGIDGIMDKNGRYDESYFNTLRKTLRFHSVGELLSCIESSGSFLFERNSKNGIVAFYSMLHGVTNVTKVTNVTPSLVTNTTSMAKELKSKERTSRSRGKIELTEEHMQTVREWMERLEGDLVWKETIVAVVKHELQNGISKEQGDARWHCLMYELLLPYFASRERFFNTDDQGRAAWLRELLLTDNSWGKHLKYKSMALCRERMKEAIAEHHRQELRNSKNGPHEYASSDGRRFYLDPTEGEYEIPPYAPGRPSATARWNPWKKQWK